MRYNKALKLYITTVGLIGQAPSYIQAYKIFVTKSAKDLSLLGCSISLFSVLSWLIYGIIIKDTPLIICNILGLLGLAIVLAAILNYS